MASLFRNRFSRAVGPRRHRSRGVSPTIPLERLEPRLALAGDSAASGFAQLQPAAAVYFSDSLIGPNPIVFTESQVVGREIPSFVI